MLNQKKTSLSLRILSLFLTAVLLCSFAVSAFAMEDLSSMGGLPDITDMSSGEIVDMGVGTVITPENSGSTGSATSSSYPENVSSGNLNSTTETPESKPPKDEQQVSSAAPVTGNTEAFPPDGFSFPATLGDTDSRARSSSSTTIYMQKDSSIQHMYPFNGGNLQPAYIFTTADGKAAYCVEPARWNSVNGDVVTGSQTLASLSAKQQSEIARTIAASGGSASNHAYYMAAQAIIWETAYGQKHGSGSVYNAVIAANASKLSAAYHDILSKMSAGGEIPSFMSPDPKNPTQHQMSENGGSYSIDLENTNTKVSLKAGDFKSKAAFQFSVSGNTLKVTSASTPDEDSYTEWHSNEQSGSGLVFWSSGRQAKASLLGGEIPGDGYMVFSGDFNLPLEEDGESPGGEQKEPGLGYLTIYKYDGKTNLPLAGAIFKIESDSYVNDAFELPYGGKTVVIPIPVGQDSVDVSVTEVRAPDGYVMDTAPKMVTVTKNDNVNIAEVSFVNMPEECALTIVKHETGNSGVKLPGARFRIRYADVNVSAQVWTETTDAGGEIHIQLPYPGTLVIEELEAPAGYVIGAVASHTITVARGENKVVNISNDKKSQLIVTKKDNQTGQTLAGATIKAILLRSNTQPHEAGQVFTQTTGPDGRAVFSNLIPGEYRVEEASPPQYYLGTDVVHNVNIPEGNSETITLEFRNEPWTGLTIKKVDATNDKGLQGAIFKVQSSRCTAAARKARKHTWGIGSPTKTAFASSRNSHPDITP